MPALATDPVHAVEPAAAHQLIDAHAQKSVLRFITCGSVDDGKSTLIGRLLFETGNIAQDQLDALARDSIRFGTQGGSTDYALLLDGLAAEREQGITIDVAYRFFSTPMRKFIVADCPGHAQYTRNMATGASTAELAVVLLDARKGLMPQTLRHTHIVAMFGVRHIVLAVNKMDAVDYSEARFHDLAQSYRTAAAGFGISQVEAIPLSALHGDNLVQHSRKMPWYRGSSLLSYLTQVNVRTAEHGTADFMMPVQWVARPSQDFRGFAGSISSGALRLGDSLVVRGSSTGSSSVRSILRGDAHVTQALAGDSVILELDDAVDVSRGDLLLSPQFPAVFSDTLEVKLLCLGDAPISLGQSVLLRLGTSERSARIDALQDPENPGSAPQQLATNAIAHARIALESPLWLTRFEVSRALGAFVLVDRFSNATIAAGTISDAITLKHDQVQSKHADKAASKAFGLWFTGVSGAGKTTLAEALKRALSAQGLQAIVLDGDALRKSLSADLGFSEHARREHVRRVAAVAELLLDAGLIVLISVIAPYRDQRAQIQEQLGSERLLEVHVDASLAIRQQRDPKGLYQQANAGTLQGLSGFDAVYEVPLTPDLVIQTDQQAIATSTASLLALLRSRGLMQ
jgi:bifunctional enzyme CysN/CysC